MTRLQQIAPDLGVVDLVEETTPRALATIDHPVRHTGLVEKRGTRWYAVDLFPRSTARRNASWIDQVASGVQAVHQYAGKPLLDFYLGKSAGDSAANALGGGEKLLFAKVSTPKPAAEKQPTPSTGASALVAQRTQPGAAQTDQSATSIAQGGTSGSQKDTRQPGNAASGGLASAQLARTDGAAGGQADEAEEGDDYDPHDSGTGAIAQRGWSGEWWGF